MSAQEQSSEGRAEDGHLERKEGLPGGGGGRSTKWGEGRAETWEAWRRRRPLPPRTRLPAESPPPSSFPSCVLMGMSLGLSEPQSPPL